MFNTKELKQKWSPILEANEAPAFKDKHRADVTAVLLENTERALSEERGQQQFMSEAAPTNNIGGGNIATWDPVLISLVRRAMPNLIAYDLCGVQPMTGPTGLIFAMRSRYTNQTGNEAMFNEADTDFSGLQGGALPNSLHGGDTDSLPVFGADANADGVEDTFGHGVAMPTPNGEALGDGVGPDFNEMAFSIEKATVTAQTRALKAEYTMELAQDLKAIHGLDAEAELANLLSAEILAEINRELIRTINVKAKLGCQQADIAAPGIFDLNVDSDGRWSMEKYKGLLVQIQREANVIAKETRRGKGNFLLVSSDVAAVLSATGMLDYSPALASNANLSVDDTGATFAGTISGGVKVYIDPYAANDYVTIGYKGTSAYDAGMFYCPYVPLTMVRAVGENTFQPKIGFKTRYGMVANPFVGAAAQNGTGLNRQNQYYRIFGIQNILGV